MIRKLGAMIQKKNTAIFGLCEDISKEFTSVKSEFSM